MLSMPFDSQMLKHMVRGVGVFTYMPGVGDRLGFVGYDFWRATEAVWGIVC